MVRHYNKHAAVDPHLRLQDDNATLYGTVAKSHLWCALWAYKGGHSPTDGGSQPTHVQGKPENLNALQDPLKEGLWYRVITLAGLATHRDRVVQMMEEDNQKAAFDKAEGEVGLLSKIHAELHGSEDGPKPTLQLSLIHI